MRVKWQNVFGLVYEGEVVKVEEDGDGMTADVLMDDGTVKAIPTDALTPA